MDKCKYYLNFEGTNIVFDSDKALTQFVRDNLATGKGSGLSDGTTVVGSFNVNKTSTPTGNLQELRVYQGEFDKKRNSARLVKNFEGSKDYAVHFGDFEENPRNAAAAMRLLMEHLPEGASLKQFGSLSYDAIGLLAKVAKSDNFVMIKSGIALKVQGEDNLEAAKAFFSKLGLDVNPRVATMEMDGDIYPGNIIFDGFTVSKSIQNLRVKYSKIDTGLLNTQDKALEGLKAGIDPYSSNYAYVGNFLKEQQLVNGNLQLLSPVFEKDNYRGEAIESILKSDEYKAKVLADPVSARAEAETEIDNEIELDYRMRDLSVGMSDLMKNMISLKHTLNAADINHILDLVARYNTYDKFLAIQKLGGTPEEIANAYTAEVATYMAANFTNNTRENIKKQLTNWYKDINNSSSKFLANVQLTKALSNSNTNGVYSYLSYVGISPEGVPNIYEIKSSRKPFKQWHSAKKLTTDYKLGINRQLVENIADTSGSSLFIVPVIFPEKAGFIDINAFYIDNSEDRSMYSSHSGLEAGGKISEALISLMPAKIRLDDLKSKILITQNKEVLGIMFPKYNFRTKTMIKDAEKLVADAVAKSDGQPKLKMWDSIDKKEIIVDNTPAGKIEFERLVTEYVKKAMLAENSQISDLSKAILSAKSGAGENKKNKEIKHGRSSLELQRMFNDYLTDDWELVVNRPELLNSGLLVFRNNVTLTFEVVAITVNLLDQINNLGEGDTLMGKFRNNEAYKGDNKVLKATSANIEVIKALTVLNNDPELMKGYSLASVKVFNALANKGEFAPLELALYNFNLLLTQVSKTKTVPNNFANKNIKVANFSKILYAKILSTVGKIDNNKALRAYATTELGDLSDLADNKQKLDWLLKLREEMVTQHKQLILSNQREVQDFTDPIEYAFYLVSQGIAYYVGLNGIFDYDTPQYGIRTGDALHWVRTAMFGDAPDHDSNGNKIVGLFQGQHFNTTDALDSTYMRKIHGIINIAKNKISAEFRKRSHIITGATDLYYQELGRSNVEKYLIGSADQFHEVFFETHLGKITKDFKLLNPWDTTGQAAILNTSQRKYLKMFIFNQYISRRGSNLSIDTLEKFEKSTELADLQVTGKIDLILKVPLIKSMQSHMYKTLTTEGFRKMIGQTLDSIKNSLDVRDLTGLQREGERSDDAQKIGVYEAINGFKRVYNSYEAQESEELRSSMLEKYGVTNFEVNLDTIALKYAYESLREKHLNEVLPIVQSAFTVMKFYGWQTGRTKETKEALDDAIDQLTTSVYNTSPIKGKEIEEALGWVRTAQRGVSAMLLMFRPTLMVKELVVGTIKNASFAWSKVYGDDSFTMEHLTDSYSRLLSPKDYDVIYELNAEYRIANRDMNQIVEKTKVDQYGVNFLGQYMYWFNTAPDYINRVTLLVAKMLKDGSFAAHSIGDDGTLKYDPSKDERYSYYFKNREVNKFLFHPTDMKYNDQRSLYLQSLKEFNEEILFKGEATLTEKDNTPSAYFNKQRVSIKNFTDTAYGAYDSDLTPSAAHAAYGIVFGQFLKYWPAKVKYYFSPTKTDTVKGKMNHKHKINADGVMEYYYQQYTQNPETKEWYYEEVPESKLSPTDPRAKAWEWEGEINEGLMYSLMYTVHDMLHGEEIDPTTQTSRNAKVCLHDLMVMILAMFLGTIMTADAKAPKAEKMGLYERIIPKIAYRATSEYNPFTSVFGVFQAPPFMALTKSAYDDLLTVISGNTTAAQFMTKNVKLFELVPTLSRK